MIQQGDILLFQSTDDGDVNLVNGVLQMSSGLESAVYLSLFGGNADDDGLDKNARNWWGNLDEKDEAKHLRSETQYLLESLPATTGNLNLLRKAVERDLDWFKTEGIANTITVKVSLPELNKVKIDVTIDEFGINYVENWKVRV